MEYMKNKARNLILPAIGVVVLIFLIVFYILGNNNTEKVSDSLSVPSGSIEAVGNNFDFKIISMKDGKVSHKFEIQNNGNEQVKITKIYTSCMCTTAYLENSGDRKGPFGMPGHGVSALILNEPVESGEKVSIEAIFDPAAHGPQGTGLVKRVVYVETNSLTTPIVELFFEANVIL